MTYAERLKAPQWQKKRLEIFNRDNWTCRFCHSKERTLTVHHLCYFQNTNPWEYDDDFLITLCETCHESNEAYVITFLAKLFMIAVLKNYLFELEKQTELDFDKNISCQIDCIHYLLGDM